MHPRAPPGPPQRLNLGFSLSLLNLILATFTSSPATPWGGAWRRVGNGLRRIPLLPPGLSPSPRKSKAEKIYILTQASRRKGP